MRLAAVLLLALAGGPALAAATLDGAVADCRRPNPGAERAICANPALQAADQALAALVAEWRQRVPEAEAAQQDWLRRRNRMCAPAMRPDCLDIAYAERTAWLRATLAALQPPVPTAVVHPPVAPTPPDVAASQPSGETPAAPPAPPRVLVPAVAPGLAVASLAVRLATAPCAAVSSTALRRQGWTVADAPFGMALDRWAKADFAALMRRASECQAENIDNARNLQLMLNVLNQLRGTSQESPPTEPTPVAPPLAAASPKATPQQPSSNSINCADPALLQDVAFTFQATPGVSNGVRIRQMLRPRPYTDVIMEAYGASAALQAEYRRLQPYMAPVPQCLVDAETADAVLTLSYRLYAEGGQILIEVQRVP
jgi:uncharacterized protein